MSAVVKLNNLADISYSNIIQQHFLFFAVEINWANCFIKWFGAVRVSEGQNHQIVYLDSALRPWNPKDALWIDSILLQKRQQLQKERKAEGKETLGERERTDKHLLLTSAGYSE